MKTQLEFLKEIIALKEAHPHARVQFWASADECRDDFPGTAHKITRVEFDPMFWNGDKYLCEESEIRSWIEDDIMCKHIFAEFEGQEGKKLFATLVERAYEEGAIDAIQVTTSAGEGD